MTDTTVLEEKESARKSTLVGTPTFQLSAIILAGGSANYALVTLGPLQETVRVAMGLSDTQIALVQGPALYLSPVLVALPLGFLIDRFPRPRLLAIFTLLEVVGTVATALAPSLAMMVLARVARRMRADRQCDERHVRWWHRVVPTAEAARSCFWASAQMAYVSAGFALGGHLLAALGNWRWAMLGLAAPLGLVFLLALWVCEPARERAPRPRLEWRPAVTGLWRYWGVLIPLSVGQISLNLGYTASMVWASPIFARRFGLAPERIGSIMGIVRLVSGVMGPILGGYSRGLMPAHGRTPAHDNPC